LAASFIIHEGLRTTPANALGIADRAWIVAQLVDATLAVAPRPRTLTSLVIPRNAHLAGECPGQFLLELSGPNFAGPLPSRPPGTSLETGCTTLVPIPSFLPI
jgi:hypothetical protein